MQVITLFVYFKKKKIQSLSIRQKYIDQISFCRSNNRKFYLINNIVELRLSYDATWYPYVFKLISSCDICLLTIYYVFVVSLSASTLSQIFFYYFRSSFEFPQSISFIYVNKYIFNVHNL